MSYWGADFFSFFSIFFSRLFRGESLCADEMQLYALLALSVGAGVLSPFLFLRKMGMAINALSHTTLLGVVVVALLLGSSSLLHLPSLLLGAIVAAILTLWGTEKLSTHFFLGTDASIGLVFTTLFSLAIVLIALFFHNVHMGIEVILGNIDAISLQDVYMMGGLALTSVLFVTLTLDRLKILSFDPSLAKTLGLQGRLLQFLLLGISALLVMGAFRSVGVVLVLTFFVVPPMLSRRLCHRLPALMGMSILWGALASFLGVALSRHVLTMTGVPLSTGACVSVLLSLFYLVLVGIHCIVSSAPSQKFLR